MLNPVWLKSLVAIVQTGSFQSAARALGLAQPTVSQHLQKLEEQVGVTLVQRSRSGCQPTTRALAFMPHATALLEGAAVLDERRLDGQVAMSRKACARLCADALAGERLGRQDVTKAPWRPYGQARPPSLAPRLLEASKHRRFSTPQ